MVLKAGAEIEDDVLRKELIAMVREQIGGRHVSRRHVVQALQKTRSGKTCAKTMRQIADNDEYTVPSTIEDPSVIDALEKLLRG